MRKLVSLFLLLLPLCVSAQDKTLPVWQPGCLDIHNIATACGDCSFIKMPDGTTMLIDAGDMRGSSWDSHCIPDDSRTPAQWIAHYISKVAPGTERLDYVLLTHFHPDHHGNAAALHDGAHGYSVCGLTEVGEYFKIGKMVDRAYPAYGFPSREYIEKSAGKFFPEYLKFIERVLSDGGRAEGFEVGSRRQFPLLHDSSYDFEIFNVAGNAEMASPRGKKTVKMYSGTENPLKFDENMFSCAVRLRYGKFVYYNGGDLPGSNYGPKKPAPHRRDYESMIAGLLGHVNAMKADHHGWKDTCNPNFIWQTSPDAIVFQASHIRHPWVETVQRLVDPQLPGKRELYLTTGSGRELIGEELFSRMHAPGHVVFRVYPGGGSWQVFVLDALNESNEIIEESEIHAL